MRNYSRVVERDKEFFLTWRTKIGEDLEKYRRMEMVVKRMAQEEKKRANEEKSLNIAEDKKYFGRR